MEETKICIDCNTEKPISLFYKQKAHKHGVMSYCKDCFNKRCTERWIQRKIDAIKCKGSKCENCSLELNDYNYPVFEFHHLDPTKKEFDWSKLRLQTQTTITKELDKCQLLCANCHRLVHSLEFPDQSESH